MGPLARLTVLALSLFSFVPAAAAAAPPDIHVVGAGAGASPFAASLPLTVPGRAPVGRFSHDSSAGASSLRVSNAAATGVRTNGKIVGVDPREGAFSCSGTALNTPSRSIVLTAGHCVLANGITARRIAFVPAYDHGRRPYGTFHAESVYVMPQWRHGENPDFDVAALRVAPNELGSLADVVGARGYVTSKSRLSAFQIFGYPAASLEGKALRSCRAHGLGSDALTNGFSGPPTMPVSCDMAAGSSGGGWIVEGQYIDGVTSYSYAGRPTRLFSPYFGPAVGSFLRELP
jgi:V8-like Glu-specific endopeptidase